MSEQIDFQHNVSRETLARQNDYNDCYLYTSCCILLAAFKVYGYNIAIY